MKRDFLVSLVLLCLSVNWLRSPEKRKDCGSSRRRRRLAVAVSLPSLFTIGAIALVGFFQMLRRRTPATALAFIGFLTTAGLSVVAMAVAGQYRTPARRPRVFPQVLGRGISPGGERPRSLARWLVRANTGPLFSFPYGADMRLAWLTPVIFGCFASGAVLLLRRARVSSPFWCFHSC